MRLKDSVAIVTGGSSGIGRATALKMAAEGAKVVITGLEENELVSAAEEIKKVGGEVLYFRSDVSDETSVKDVVAAALETWGKIDIAFANAGTVGVFSPIEDQTLEEWEFTNGVNMRGTFLVMKHVIPHMRENGGGSIIVNASVNGTRIFSNAGFCSYSSSKGGQNALAKTAAVELARWNIRVNTIMPGYIKTGIGDTVKERNLEGIQNRVDIMEKAVPLGKRFGAAEEVANAVVFLASSESSYVTGTDLFIDGGLSLVQ